MVTLAPHEQGYGAGARRAVPMALASVALGISFGVLAAPVMGKLAPIVMSAVVCSGAAQFAVLSVLAAGGSAGAAIAAGVLMNARFVAMGFAAGPSFAGGRLSRALQAQALVDASFALASRGDGTFDRTLLIGATLPQASGWLAGTVAGVLAGPVLGDPRVLGLDAVFVAFYLALLWEEAGSRLAQAAAATGGMIALLLMPFVPVGLPIVAATLAVLVGWRRR